MRQVLVEWEIKGSACGEGRTDTVARLLLCNAAQHVPVLKDVRLPDQLCRLTVDFILKVRTRPVKPEQTRCFDYEFGA